MAHFNFRRSIVNIKFSALFLICFVFGSEMASSTSFYRNEAEEALYKQGMRHLDQKEYQKAKDFFLPLAEKGHLEAEHNYAYCSYHLGEEIDAYCWFKHASNKGFNPAENHLNKMNLLYLLLPDDLLMHIASFLKMEHFAHFKCLSQRAYSVAKNPMLKNGYDAEVLLKDVHFEPQPKEIKILPWPKVDKGSIEVHFRDSQHLKQIATAIPLIGAKDRIYFVKDEHAKGYSTLLPTVGELQWDHFVCVIADYPVKISGTINLPCAMVLPQKTDISKLTREGKELVFRYRHDTNVAMRLAQVLNSFDERRFQKSTDAQSLLTKRKQERLETPDNFPDLKELCPNALFVSDQTMNIVTNDYLASKGPLVYMAKSIEDINTLHTTMPDFKKSISYIDHSLKYEGVYCHDLYVSKGFEIHTEGSLVIFGTVKLNDDEYNFLVNCKNSAWLWVSLKVDGHCTIDAKNRWINIPLGDAKPDEMPLQIWKELDAYRQK